MVSYPNTYVEYVEAHGVGNRDKVASGPKKYLQMLNKASELLQVNITPTTLRNDADVDQMCQQLAAHRAESTVGDYRSVLRQYVSMVNDYSL